MTCSRSACSFCGIEFPDTDPRAPPGWYIDHCPTCGSLVEVWRGPVLCRECGIEFETTWVLGARNTPQCPTCGATAALDRPAPNPPEPVGADGFAVEIEDEERAAAVPAPVPKAAPEEEFEGPRRPVPRTAPVPPARDAWAERRIVLIVVCLFAIACGLPAIRTGRDEYVRGVLLFACGCWMCPLWLANPLLYYGCRALWSGRNGAAFVRGVIACLCSLPLFVAMSDLWRALSWGYYLWQADMIFFTISAAVLYAIHGPGTYRAVRRGARR